MSILKADILSFVNEALVESYSGTQLDEAIKSCLADLSDANLLSAQDAHVLTVGDKSFAMPDDFKEEVSVTPSLNSVDCDVLMPFPGGLKELKDLAASTSTPRYYLIYNKTMYLDCAASSAFTITTEYYKFHADTADTIEFGYEFTNVIKFGTAYFKALFRKKSSYIQIWRPIYEEAKAKRIALVPQQPHIVRG